MSTIFKKSYRKESITVITRKDLGDVLKERYETIIIKGELSKRVLDEMNGYRSGKDTVNYVVHSVLPILGSAKSLQSFEKYFRDYRVTGDFKDQVVLKLKEETKGRAK